MVKGGKLRVLVVTGAKRPAILAQLNQSINQILADQELHSRPAEM